MNEMSAVCRLVGVHWPQKQSLIMTTGLQGHVRSFNLRLYCERSCASKGISALLLWHPISLLPSRQGFHPSQKQLTCSQTCRKFVVVVFVPNVAKRQGRELEPKGPQNVDCTETMKGILVKWIITAGLWIIFVSVFHQTVTKVCQCRQQGL